MIALVLLAALLAWYGLAGRRLAATLESMLIARSIEALAVAAKAANDLDEGRLREDILDGLRERVFTLGLDAAADKDAAKGPRGVFDSKTGLYEAPGGAVWDFAGNGGTTDERAKEAP